MASTPTPGFRPGSATDWRKRLSSTSRYIDDLEHCLAQANQAVKIQALRLESQEAYLATLIAERDQACARLAELKAAIDAGRAAP
jgi:chromosome segregation ATPase